MIEDYRNRLMSIDSNDYDLLASIIQVCHCINRYLSDQINKNELYELIQHLQIQAAIDSNYTDPVALEQFNIIITELSAHIIA